MRAAGLILFLRLIGRRAESFDWSLTEWHSLGLPARCCVFVRPDLGFGIHNTFSDALQTTAFCGWRAFGQSETNNCEPLQVWLYQFGRTRPGDDSPNFG